MIRFSRKSRKDNGPFTKAHLLGCICEEDMRTHPNFTEEDRQAACANTLKQNTKIIVDHFKPLIRRSQDNLRVFEDFGNKLQQMARLAPDAPAFPEEEDSMEEKPASEGREKEWFEEKLQQNRGQVEELRDTISQLQSQQASWEDYAWGTYKAHWPNARPPWATCRHDVVGLGTVKITRWRG